MIRALRAAALVLLLVGAVPASAGTPPGEAPLRWWGPEDQGKGHHMRVPVTVTNPWTFPVLNAPAIAELDLGEVLRGAGWVTAPSGDRDVLQSFRLDLDSVRVVAMTNLVPPSPGSLDGSPRTVDSGLSEQDLRRFEPPSIVLPGFLQRPQDEPFNEQTNPVVTVIWEVAGVLRGGESRHFMVYFDAVQNREHAPVDHAGRPGWAHLQGLYGPGPGLELVGVPTAGTSGISTATVLALQGGTSVRVFTATPGGQWSAAKPPQGFPPNPATLAANQPTALYAGNTAGSMVRLVADKPILAYGVGTGFVPSLDAGMAGKSFLFAKTATTMTDDTIHFVSTTAQPTTVVVQRVPPDGQTFTFTMNDGNNPLPYTPSARAAGFQGTQQNCAALSTTNNLPGPGLYSATVSAGGPVLLQHAPLYGLTQVPAADGSPTGTAAWSAMGWSDSSLFTNAAGKPVCQTPNRVGSWLASSLEQSTTVRVTSPESPMQIDPPGTNADPFPAGRAIPVSPSVSARFPAPFRDRPLAFTSEAAGSVLFTGMHPPLQGGTFNGRVPVIHGPLRGDGMAQQFATIGPTLVYAPYSGTQVVGRLEASQSGVVTQAVDLVAGGVQSFGDLSPNNWVGGVHLVANKPVIAYPTQLPATWAAMPMFLQATPGPGEFRGHLVQAASPNGLDPVSGSTVVGGAITYTVRITNLGRHIGGADLPDSVDLALSPDPPGWRATLDRTSIGPLASNETQEVQLTVRPGPDVPPGSLGVYTVQATSRGNPAMQDSLSTVTYIQRSFDVGLWFSEDVRSSSGGKVLTRSVDADGTRYPIIVQNQGSVQDVIRLEATLPAEGWTVRLLRDGRDVRDLTMAAGEKVALRLHVVPPAGVLDGVLVTTVTADSLSSPALDRVTATTRVRSPSDLDLDIAREQVTIDPGAEAVFPMVLNNAGGATEIEFSTVADALPGWAAPAVVFQDPATGARVNLTRYSLGAGEAFPFAVRVRAPAHAAADEVLGLRFAAQPREGGDGVEAFLYAIVRAKHDLRPSLPPQPVAAETGQTTAVAVRLANHGNLDERLAWRMADVPDGWGIDLPEALLVPRNGTQSFQLNLTLPAGQPAGLYNVTVHLVSQDGNTTPVRLRVGVGLQARADAASPARVELVQPGRPAQALVPVRNDGNVPLLASLQPHPDEPWTLRGDASSYRVAPGANLTIPVAWDVPRNAPDGPSVHLVRVALVRDDGTQAALQDARASFDVGRADLRVQAVAAHPAPGGTLVEATVVNAGSRTAHGFVIRLLAGTQPVEDLQVAALPAGDEATVRLLLPDGPGGDPGVLADALDAVAESDEANNAGIAGGPQAQGAPGAGILIALAALALAVARRERRA